MGTTPRHRALSLEAIQPLLRTKTFGRTLYLLEETPSTNSEALRLAQEGASDGTTVVAERQTAGRGRLGRQWYSPPGENLYCSVLLRQTPLSGRMAEWLSWVPLTSAIAAAHASQELSKVRVALKWPNDLLVGTQKMGGILCESGGSGSNGLFVVVGIGLNVNTPAEGFPEELRVLATSLTMATGTTIDRNALLASLLNQLETWQLLLLTNGPPAVSGEYTALCVTLGQRILATLASGESVRGLAEAIGSDGSLRIRLDHQPNAFPGTDHIAVRDAEVTHLRRI